MAFSFGQPAAAAPGGAVTSTPSFSFGGAQPQQQQQQQQQQKPAGFNFSFGGTGTSNAGATTPVQAGGSSLVGQQQSQPQPQQQAGSSLFGNTQSQPQQQQQGQQSSLFGQSNTSSSLFGQSQQQQPQQQQQQSNLGGSSLFGKPLGGASSTPFGQPSQQPNQPLTLSGFGSTASYNQTGQQAQTSRPGGALFGAPPGMAANPSLGATQATHDKRLGMPLNDKLEAIRAAWDMQNIHTCQFLYYFYNSIPPEPPSLGEAALANPNFGRRQDAIGPKHDALWLQTLRENPDRSKLVPVLAIGFPDLKSRIEAQQAETARQSNKLGELQKRLDELTSKHTLSNSVRISAITRKQTSLHQRLLGLAKRIHLLIPAIRGHSITGKEEQLKNLLHLCEMELASISTASGSGLGQIGTSAGGEDNSAVVQHRLRGRINELWALLTSIKAKREASVMTGDHNRLEWAVVDEGAMDDVVKILGAQQQGLDHLSKTLESDTRALDTIVKGLEGVELIGTK